MEFLVKKVSGCLIPVYNSDAEALKDCKLKEGQVYEVSIVKKRNIDHHRKYFALINMCFDNQEVFDDIQSLRYYVTCKAGYYKSVDTGNGAMIIPDSIKFSKMDQIEFEDFYRKSLNTICNFLETSEEVILNELVNFM